MLDDFLLNYSYDAWDEEYVQKLYPTANKYLYGSSFGAYIVMLCLCNGSAINYKCIFFKSPAIKMDKILINSLIEENFEEFERNGRSSDFSNIDATAFAKNT